MATEKPKKVGDAKVLKDYFGLREGETIRDFAAELKALTPEDKEQLASGIRDETFTY